MKNCEERTEYIIGEIEKRLEAKKRKRRTAEHFSALAACFCFALIISFKVFPQMELMRKTPIMKINKTDSSEIPDISQINDISAYVSQIMKITSDGGKIPHYENGADNKSKTEKNSETSESAFIVSEKKSSASGSTVSEHETLTEQQTILSRITSQTTAVSEKMSGITEHTSKSVHTRPKENTVTVPSTVNSGGNDENGGRGSEWEDMSVFEQYDTITFNGVIYTTNGKIINPESVPEKAGDIIAVGNDYHKNEIHCTDAEAFRIDDIPDTDGVAVLFDGHTEYYVYTSIGYLYSNNCFLFS